MYKVFVTLVLATILCLCFSFSYAQDVRPNFITEFEKTAQSIVMVRADYGEKEEFGAGIIFGREKDRLLIVTAHHIFKGVGQPKNIGVRFRSMPENKYSPAKLLRFDDDGGLDVAVLSVENLKEQGVDVCSIPFDRLGKTSRVQRGDAVYAVGNPNGVSWATPVIADKISQINGNLIDFQSNFIGEGHSGGGLLDERGSLIGMTIKDAQPFGQAINLGAILGLMKKWKYTVQLDTLLPGKWTPLHLAAYKGDSVAVAFHLKDCGDANAVNTHNATPLHCAAFSGNVYSLSLLLKSGANPNILDGDGDLPLEWAIEKKCFECVKMLVSAGTKLNTQNKKGETVLHIAIDSGQQKITKLLIEAGANVNLQDEKGNSPLQCAAAREQLEIVQALLKAGANVNVKRKGRGFFGERFVGCQTPLAFAIVTGNIELIKALLKAGAKTDLDSDSGLPLYLAIEKGDIEIIKLLIAYRANLNITSRIGTPLSFALSNYKSDQKKVDDNSIIVIKTLIEHGADVNLSTEKEYLPIFIAIKTLRKILIWNKDDVGNGGAELLRILIKAGVNLNVDNGFEKTPLMIVLSEIAQEDESIRYLEYVKILLAAGADPNFKNEWEESPFDKVNYNASKPADTNYNNHWEIMKYSLELLKIFLQAGVKLNVHDRNGNTPLYKAVDGCLFGSKDPVFIVMLLKAGADPNFKNKDGNTPMDRAGSFHSGNEQVIKLLKQYGGK